SRRPPHPAAAALRLPEAGGGSSVSLEAVEQCSGGWRSLRGATAGPRRRLATVAAGALQEPRVLRVRVTAAGAGRELLRLQQRVRPRRWRAPVSGGRRRRRRRWEGGVLGEVELGAAAAEAEGGAVVGAGGVLGGVEGAEPHARRLVRVPDLRRPLPPRPLPHPSVPLPRRAAAGVGRGRRRELLLVAGRRRRRRVLPRRWHVACERVKKRKKKQGRLGQEPVLISA
ncbi:Os12g0168150, partial [Oryza sativa Japonica Group]